MKPIIKMEELPSSKRNQLLRILEKNKVKNPRKKSTVLSKIHLRSIPFGLTDYLKYINDKLKR